VDEDDDRVITQDRDRGIRGYFWAHDNRHIFYVQDVGGNENFRLYSVHTDTGKITEHTPYDNVTVRIVSLNPHFPHELLIGLNKENPKVHDVYRLNLLTGELSLVAKNNGRITSWIADRQFQVRAASTTTPDGGSELLIRDDEQSEWKSLIVWDSDDSPSSRSYGFSQDGKAMYLADARGVNAGKLVKLELSTGVAEVIAEDDTYDIDGVMIHPETYEIQAVAFIRAKKEWLILDKKIQDDFERLSLLDNGELFIASRDHSDRTWLIGFQTDIGPTPYYAYHRETNKVSFLFHTKPDLNQYELSPKEPMSFTSRDGLTIHGYITFPPGLSRRDLPMVLCVHGGPWGRDKWGFDSQAQWFANRGYICLQVNFRGSTGYGKNFVNAGDREWGARMHDDLVDAVHWAIEQGFADSDRIAIFGGSYGGYAALVGATFTPDLFCCAVDIVGPSNIATLIRSTPPYWAPMLDRLHKRVGNPDTDEAFLQSRSPLFKVDQIKIPILIAQGANDPRVKQAESEQIVAAMKQKGLEYEYMLFPDEGHGFAKPQNRMAFYAAAEKFLAKHLGGRHEEA
jgi:dipeptidyl aminopeptidase/acylaminoacyl peptidase